MVGETRINSAVYVAKISSYIGNTRTAWLDKRPDTARWLDKCLNCVPSTGLHKH